MGDNLPDFAGGRIRIVDPNQQFYQDSTNVFGANSYNMSVPLEDLSIMVEFTTQKKGRSIITLDRNNSQIRSDNPNQVTLINFIDYSKNKQTSNEKYLKTNNTNLSSQKDDKE